METRTTAYDHTTHLKYTLPLIISLPVLVLLAFAHLPTVNNYILMLVGIVNLAAFIWQLHYIAVRVKNTLFIRLLLTIYLITLVIIAGALVLGDIRGAIAYSDSDGSHVVGDLLAAASFALISWIPLYVVTTIYLYRKRTVYSAAVKKTLLTLYGIAVAVLAFGVFSVQMSLHDPSVE